jgi:hypothetical protein
MNNHWRAPNFSAANSRRSKRDLVSLNSKISYAAPKDRAGKLRRFKKTVMAEQRTDVCLFEENQEGKLNGIMRSGITNTLPKVFGARVFSFAIDAETAVVKTAGRTIKQHLAHLAYPASVYTKAEPKLEGLAVPLAKDMKRHSPWRRVVRCVTAGAVVRGLAGAVMANHSVRRTGRPG